MDLKETKEDIMNVAATVQSSSNNDSVAYKAIEHRESIARNYNPIISSGFAHLPPGGLRP